MARWSLGEYLHDHSNRESELFSQPSVHLYGVHSWSAGSVDAQLLIRDTRLWLHGLDVYDPSATIQKEDVQWNKRVFHPEGNVFFMREDKKHS